MDQKIDEISIPRRRVRRVRKDRIVILLAAIAFFTAGFVYAIFGGDTADEQAGKLAAVFATPMKERINILVLGADERADDVGRSDTIFLVTVDTVGKKTTVLSIPRDTRVKIDGYGWDKINHAYAFGGSKLSKTAVEKLLGIPIDYTVVINFNGFVRMIDALGGVTIDVEKRMYYSDPYDDNGGLYIDLQPGVQRLNGKSAIQYVRYRDEDGDIGRVARQQKFLKALLQEFTKPQLITKLPDLIKEFARAVRTDMPSKEMVKLIPIVSDAAKSGLNTEQVTGTPLWIQDVSYWLPDIRELRAKIALIEGITADNRYTQEAERLAYEYEHSVPREVTVANASTTAKKAVNDKQTAASTKTTNKVAASSLKPKSDSSSTSGQANSDTKQTKNANGQGTATSGINKNAE